MGYFAPSRGLKWAIWRHRTAFRSSYTVYDILNKMNWGYINDVIMTSFMNKWIFVLDSVSDRKSNAFFIQLIFWNAQVNVEIRPSKRKAWDLNINFWYDTTIVRVPFMIIFIIIITFIRDHKLSSTY